MARGMGDTCGHRTVYGHAPFGMENNRFGNHEL